MSGIIDWNSKEMIAARNEILRRLVQTMVDERHTGPGFIARNAYDISRDCFKTCISCGSKTQPCCGH